MPSCVQLHRSPVAPREAQHSQCIANMVYHGSSSRMSSRKLLVASALLSSVLATPLTGNQRSRMHQLFQNLQSNLTTQQSMASTSVEHTAQDLLPSLGTGRLRNLSAGKMQTSAIPRLARPLQTRLLLVARRTTPMSTLVRISPLTRAQTGGIRTISVLISRVSSWTRQTGMQIRWLTNRRYRCSFHHV